MAVNLEKLLRTTKNHVIAPLKLQILLLRLQIVPIAAASWVFALNWTTFTL